MLDLNLKELRAKQRAKKKAKRDAVLAKIKNPIKTAAINSKGKSLPRHVIFLINALRIIIYTHRLAPDNGHITVKTCEKVLRTRFEILVLLLTTTDLVSGQIGYVKNKGMDTTSHDDLMLAYVKRYGKPITESTYYSHIRYFKEIGIYHVEPVYHSNKQTKTVRSAPAYKYLSLDFLRRLGTFKPEIRQSIKAAYDKAIAKGFNFAWRVFKGFSNTDVISPAPYSDNDLFHDQYESPITH